LLKNIFRIYTMKNKTTKRKYNSKKKSHKSHAGIKSPTSISFEKDKTPRLSGDNDIAFTLYTTKNISSHTIQNSQYYNVFLNGKLAYKRAPRGSAPDFPTKVKWGPSAFRLTKDNYTKLKKGSKIYMDRDSVHFRGPIVFDKILRGPKIRVYAKDRGYDDIYYFILDVKKIKDFQLYAISSNSMKKSTRSYKKSNTRKTKGTRKTKKKGKKKVKKKVKKSHKRHK
tara:strand:+ start:3384 stop:4058 length:675 start_codon:yes stop_codon:yes gene_type:complete